MWPFKRKNEKSLRPVPVPEIWEWDSAIGYRVNGFLELHPEAMFEIAASGFSVVSVYFDGVGTATLSVSHLAENHVELQPICWVSDDPDRARRGFGFTGYGSDGSLRITLPASPLEQVSKGFVFQNGRNVFTVKPTQSVSEVDQLVARMERDGS